MTSKTIIVVFIIIVAVPLTLLWARWRTGLSVRFDITTTPVTIKGENPLYAAVLTDMEIEEFTTLLETHQKMINQKDVIMPGVEPIPLLALCADLNLTNHVCKLMQYGADQEEARRYLVRYKGEEALKVIDSCVKETEKPDRPGSDPHIQQLNDRKPKE